MKMTRRQKKASEEDRYKDTQRGQLNDGIETRRERLRDEEKESGK